MELLQLLPGPPSSVYWIGCFVVLTILWFVWDAFFRFSDLPPGPQRWPFLDNLLVFIRPAIYELTDFALKKETGVTSVILNGVPAYVVSSDTGMQKLLSSHFVHRPESEVVKLWCNDRNFFGMMSAERWLPHRKLCHSALLAHNRSNQRQATVERGTEKLIKFLSTESKSNRPVVAFDIFCWCTLGILFDMIMQKTWSSPYDKEFSKLRDTIKVFFKWTTPGNAIDFAPFLRPFLVSEVKNAAKTRDEILYTWFKERVKTFPEHRENPRDYLDQCLLKRQEFLDNPNKIGKSLPRQFELENIFANQVDDLGVAGFDTVATAMDWTMVFFANRPDLQEKAYQEVKKVCGDTPPTLKDREKLKYVDCLIKETLRMMPVAPMVGHRAAKDTQIDGYKIPKDAVVWPNVYGLHHNPKYWKDPETFRAERWLTPQSEGWKNKSKCRWAPFGGGPRECVGMALAEEEYIDMLANVIYYFKVESVDGKPLSERAQNGIVLPTQRVPVMFKLRE